MSDDQITNLRLRIARLRVEEKEDTMAKSTAKPVPPAEPDIGDLNQEIALLDQEIDALIDKRKPVVRTQPIDFQRNRPAKEWIAGRLRRQQLTVEICRLRCERSRLEAERAARESAAFTASGEIEAAEAAFAAADAAAAETRAVAKAAAGDADSALWRVRNLRERAARIAAAQARAEAERSAAVAEGRGAAAEVADLGSFVAMRSALAGTAG